LAGGSVSAGLGFDLTFAGFDFSLSVGFGSASFLGSIDMMIKVIKSSTTTITTPMEN
jgi:hypothetical protein